MDRFPEKAFASHVAILGKTGSGKTWAARGMVESILDAGGRVCVIDPTGAWHGLRSSATGKSAGFAVVIFGGAHADLPLGGTHGEAIAEIVGTSSTPAILDTSSMRIGERTRFFADFADALIRKNKGPLHLIIDEAHLFAPQGKVNSPQAGEMLSATNNLVSLGRSRGLRIVMITQRPAKLHKDALTQCETLVAMRLIAPQDRSAVREWIDDNADKAKGQEIISSLATLKTGQGWIWAPEIGVLERISFPKIRTFDSGRAPDGTEVAGQVLAPIDREAIAQRLKAVAADAVANDPIALKRRIAELERVAAKSIPADAAALDRARQEGIVTGRKSAQESISKGIAAALNALDSIGAEFSRQMRAVKSDIEKLHSVPEPAAATVYAGNPRQRAVVRVAAPKSNGHAPAGHLPNPQQKILNKLRTLRDAVGISPVAKETLAAVCEVSASSSAYANNLGALRTAGAISYPAAGMVDLTPSGAELALLEAIDGPIHEYWLRMVSAPQRAILEELLKVHPNVYDKEALAREIGVSASSSAYANNLGRLRTLGAIDYPAPGRVALTRYVMP